MTRVVIDTNVLVSALLTERGAEAAVLALVYTGKALWCASEPIINEYRQVLSRPKFASLRPERVQRLLSALSRAIVLMPIAAIKESPDEPDNRFLECAEAAEAQYLVTGNKRHFPRRWKKTIVLNARELLDLLKN